MTEAHDLAFTAAELSELQALLDTDEEARRLWRSDRVRFWRYVRRCVLMAPPLKQGKDY